MESSTHASLKNQMLTQHTLKKTLIKYITPTSDTLTSLKKKTPKKQSKKQKIILKLKISMINKFT